MTYTGLELLLAMLGTAMISGALGWCFGREAAIRVKTQEKC